MLRRLVLPQGYARSTGTYAVVYLMHAPRASRDSSIEMAACSRTRPGHHRAIAGYSGGGRSAAHLAERFLRVFGQLCAGDPLVRSALVDPVEARPGRLLGRRCVSPEPLTGYGSFMEDNSCEHEWTLINRDEARLIYKCSHCGELRKE
jgi:hypothetical protein